MMTPRSDYDDVLQALIFARKSYGWDEEIDTWLEEAFARRGLLENSHSYSGKWDGVSFRQYNADYLKLLDQTEAEGTDSTTELLGSLLTGGQKTEDVSGGLGDFLTGGSNTDPAAGPEPGIEILTDSQSLSGTDGQSLSGTDGLFFDDPEKTEDAAFTGGSDSAAEEISDDPADAVTGGMADPSKEEKSRWLAGVGLDEQGRIAREGFGRIDFDTALEDRPVIAGAKILKPYTNEMVSVNCPDRDGHLSFLLPEGVYWVIICVSRGGLDQEQLWPYTMAGTYVEWNALTVPGEVEVKAGQTTVLPIADVS